MPQCEVCGMVAEASTKDNYGVVHNYCSHHLPNHNCDRRDPDQMTHGNHDNRNHQRHSTDAFRRLFWINLVLTVPAVLYTPLIGRWLHFSPPSFVGSAFIPLFFGTIVFFYGGTIFLKGAIVELKNRAAGMMTLISVAIIAAYIYSLASSFLTGGNEFFWELTTLIVIMLFGHWLEMSSVSAAQGSLQELAKLLPDTAERLIDGTTEKIALSELAAGDLVLVRPGAKVPADGRIINGQSTINESMITGESKPVSKKENDSVIAGTVNGDGSLKIKVSKIGDSTALAGIMRLVAEAQASRSRGQILADKAAFYLTVVALSVSLITLIGWLADGKGWPFAMSLAVTVLVITCPHALGLAVPLVTQISTSLGAKNGLLIRERLSLESARNIQIALFDKTGTLTSGIQGVTEVYGSENVNNRRVIQLAASMEVLSEHLIGKAIVNKAKTEKISLLSARLFKAIKGIGAEAEIDGQKLFTGGPKLLEKYEIKTDQETRQRAEEAEAKGQTITYLVSDKKILGVILTADTVREESQKAVADLHRLGVRVAMITGDSNGVARQVADKLGIKEYFAEVLPEDKVNKIKELQKKGLRVAMIGDGVNDAPALMQADVGIAIGAGTDVAIESAGIILVKSDPQDVAKIVRLSRASYRKMSQNLWWATGYNIIGIPLAAGVLASYGIVLSPAIGALLMSVSTVVVAFNAQLLRRAKL